VWDIEQRSSTADARLLRFVGLSEDDEGAGPDAVFAMVDPEDLPTLKDALARLRIHGDPIELVTRVRLPDGRTRWLSWKGQAERDVTGRPIKMTSVVRDITGQRVADEARIQSQKLEALGTLAGGIAHDFNNLLAAILGLTSLAQDQLPDDHPVHEQLSGISTASNRAAELVQRILSFSRLQEPHRLSIELPPVVEEVVQLLRSTVPASISITTDLSPATPAVLADASQVTQVVLNLVTNGAHAIGTRTGSITVRTGAVDLGPLDQPDLPAGRYATISVSDTGTGMDADLVGHIFDPFFTTKEPGTGTGLGLSVIDGIIKNHDGAVAVDSQPGRGSTFTVYLPATDEPVAADALSPRPAAHEGACILYVDDEPVLVHLAERQLATLGHHVVGYTDAEQALAAFEADPRRFDIVVTDLTMPGRNGLELARALRETRPDVPVILVSGHVEPWAAGAAAPAGIDAVLPKPYPIEQLGTAIWEQLHLRDGR
jgi:signal transduction histidine kinase/CheY-like chemotaxis protein